MVVPARSAWACESDSDCRGDRICEEGECVFPEEEEEPPRRKKHREYVESFEDETELDQRRARRRAIAGFVLAPIGLLFAGAAAFTALTFDSDEIDGAIVPLAIAFGCEAAAGASGGHGGIYAQRGLESIDREPGSYALAIAGWVAWGVGLAGLAATAIFAIDAQPGDRGLIAAGGIAGGAVATTGALLLSTHAFLESLTLGDALTVGVVHGQGFHGLAIAGSF
jgi:hypothetical protein